MNKNVISDKNQVINKVVFEAATVDREAEKQKQRQNEYKSCYIACLVGVGLSATMCAIVVVLNNYFRVEIPLLGTSMYMLLTGMTFALNLALSFLCKKAKAVYIVFASLVGIGFTYCIGYLIASILAML